MSIEIKRVGVVGCGTMGSGICEVCARGGFDVIFVESSEEAVKAGHERIAPKRRTRGRPGQDGTRRGGCRARPHLIDHEATRS